MTVLLDTDTATTAIVAALTTAMNPILVGDGVKPAGAGWQGTPGAATTFKSYLIVYGGGVAALDGSMADPKEDATVSVQTTAVSRTRAAADNVRRRARETLLDKAFAPAGFHVVWSSLEVGRPVERDDAHGEQLPLFYAVDIVHLHLTTA